MDSPRKTSDAATGAPPAPLRVRGVDELAELAGKRLGPGPWRTITQEQITAFARATYDEQWIHMDSERARESPFGSTIAHGYLTLSLCSVMISDVLEITDIEMGVNYGLERVRFPSPVRSGQRVRSTVELLSAQAAAGSVRAHFRVTVEAEHESKPACVAEPVIVFVA